MIRRGSYKEPEPWIIGATDPEYSVEDSNQTIKKSFPLSPENPELDRDQKRSIRTSLVKSQHHLRFFRGTSLPETGESNLGLAKQSTIQGTTHIENNGGNEELYSIGNEPNKPQSLRSILRLNSAMDSTKLLLMPRNSFKVSFQEANNPRYCGENTADSLPSKSKLAFANDRLLVKSASVDGRCPIDLTAKRSLLVKLDPHRGDQDLPYLLNKVGLLESQTSKATLSLKKATFASLQKSWFGSKRMVHSKTAGGAFSPSDLDVGSHDLKRERLSIGQYTLRRLNQSKETKSLKYKRINFFSGRFKDTIITTET